METVPAGLDELTHLELALHDVPAGVEDTLRAGEHWAFHSFPPCSGRAWYDVGAGVFREEIWQGGAHVATIEARTLEGLAALAMQRFGPPSAFQT